MAGSIQMAFSGTARTVAIFTPQRIALCVVVIVMVMSVILLALLFGNISFHRLFDYVADNLGYRIVQVFTFGFVQFS